MVPWYMAISTRSKLGLVIGVILLFLLSGFVYKYQSHFPFLHRDFKSVRMEEIQFKDMKLMLPSESMQTTYYNGLGAFYTFGIDKEQLQQNQLPSDFSVNISQHDFSAVLEDQLQESVANYIKDDYIYHESVCGSDHVEKLQEIKSEVLKGWQFESYCLGKVYTYYVIGPTQKLYSIAMKIEPKADKMSVYREIVDTSINSIRFD